MRWGSLEQRSCSTPSATSRGLSAYLWQLEQTSAAVANMYFVGAINRIGIEPLGDNDFYGTSYFANPRGQFVDGTASDQTEELVVRELDLDLIDEVRSQWAFYRGPAARPIRAADRPLTSAAAEFAQPPDPGRRRR